MRYAIIILKSSTLLMTGGGMDEVGNILESDDQQGSISRRGADSRRETKKTLKNTQLGEETSNCLSI